MTHYMYDYHIQTEQITTFLKTLLSSALASVTVVSPQNSAVVHVVASQSAPQSHMFAITPSASLILES